ncbi:MAG: TolC family protein, partial [Candidatus Gastranaerophilales bacterium]|nr:TolC family protein [Candidatus Gastranaerophilales bacterium]
MKKIITIFCIICLLLSTNMQVEAKIKKAQIDKYDYVNIPFWQKYNDEILINHLDTMYKNNYDLKIAAYKIEESDKIVKLSLSQELPQIAFNGYIGRTLTASDEKFGSVVIPDYSQYHYLLPLTLDYEVDLWGKNRLRTKSMKKMLEMQKQDERSLYISLTSNVAIYYYNLIKTDKLINIQEKFIETQQKICNLMQKRFDNGLATQ